MIFTASASGRKAGETSSGERPLAGLTVVDLLDEPLSAVSRIYAELGAEVIRWEADTSLANQGAESPAGLRWAIANIGKTLLIDRKPFAALAAALARADLIVEGLPQPGRPSADALLAPDRRATAVVMTVSMFGAGNSYTHWQATDLVLHALSGGLSRSGFAGRAPLAPPGELALHCAMAQAAYAGMAGLFAAQRTGCGDRIDVSILDGAVQALDPGFGISGTATLGRSASDLPPGRPDKGFQYPILPCADGHVRVCILAPRQWQNMWRWMGQPSRFASLDFNQTSVRQESTELLAALAAFFAGRTRADLEREGAAQGVPIAGLSTLAECLTLPQLVTRGAITQVAIAGGDEVRIPDGVFEIDGSRMDLRGAGSAAWSASDALFADPQADPSAPLRGLKVLDLGVIVVGGDQSRLLADLGADVVKVESAAFPDGVRHSYLPTGLSVSFAAGHRNKRSLGLNLRHPVGKALFRKLAAKADVILANFKPGTMASLGLGPDDIKAINPAAVMVESSAFGASGPWAGRLGYGPLVRAAAGLTAQWRYPDDPEGYSDSVTIYPDHVGARYGAIAALALLTRRLRTGRGGHASLSQMEVMLSHFALDLACADRGIGGSEELSDAPWGVFQAAGEDDWCAITVRHTQDWLALAGLLQRPDWQADAFATAAGRRSRRGEIEAAVAEWVGSRDADAAMRSLQAVGVPAGRMLRVSDLQDFGYFRERVFFRVDRHPFMDEPIVAERRHAVSHLVAEPPSHPAPLLGEHSAEVVRDWLAMSDGEIADLIEEGVLELVDPHVADMLSRGEGRHPDRIQRVSK